jgi:outer membrane protein assembly factor BamD (BamD/ComL family)
MISKRIFVLSAVAAVLMASATFAQRNVTPAVDPVLEADAKHNLDVARQAFRLKKAYKGVLMRFEETYAAYPEFSNIEEFLYLAGMSSYYLSQNKGKQKVNLKSDKEKDKFAPAKLREDAVAYLSLMLEKNPQTQYKDEAERILNELKSASPGQ